MKRTARRVRLKEYRKNLMINMRKLFKLVLITLLCFSPCVFAQDGDLEFTLDISSNTTPTPKIFKPNVDLGGRGFHQDNLYPQGLAAKEALDLWRKDINFSGVYRLQYDLWEISQLAKDKAAQDKLLANYEEVIKSISDAGGTVILDIFGTPAGLGKALDKKSAPLNLSVFKTLTKDTMRYLSCEKKYNIWYEVWSAPDLDDFFIGREQDYFNIYRVIAENAKELGTQFKINIPVGAPSPSGWFHNLKSNNILTPEKSLIYEFIKFCAAEKLPLDFITWHAFSSDPKLEKEITIYNKNAVELIRDWLSYFNFKRDTPLIIDEWNFDLDANMLPARRSKSYIAASYIPARIKNMSEAGIDNQVYFSLEDFGNNPENVTRNTGIFYFDSERGQYKGGPKAIYNVFKMLSRLGPNLFALKLNDEFADVIATRSSDGIAILIYNYIDPEISENYLGRKIAGLNASERESLLQIIRTGQLDKFIAHEQDIALLRVDPKVKALLTKSQELNDKSKQLLDSPRNLKISIKGIKDTYLYSRFAVDSTCGLNCEFKAVEEKEVAAIDLYQEELKLTPYSVNLIILKKKPVPPPEPEKAPVAPMPEPVKEVNKDGQGK
jgi:beta-xylosidase